MRIFLKLFICICQNLGTIIQEMQDSRIASIRITHTGLCFDGEAYTSEYRLVRCLIGDVHDSIYYLAVKFITLLISTIQDKSRIELKELGELRHFFELQRAWLQAQTQSEIGL